MSLPAAGPQVLDFFGTLLVIEPSPGQLSSDAGLLPVRQLDQRVGLTRAFADALDDPRDPDLAEHTFLEMVRDHGGPPPEAAPAPPPSATDRRTRPCPAAAAPGRRG